MIDWKKIHIGKAIKFNPSETLPKGKVARKIPMANLTEFQRQLNGFEFSEYKSGPKFRNADTLLSKITPCLENGKTAQVDILNEDEVAFGSSEFIVLRATKYTDPDFVYYLSISPTFRKRAISCMEGTSGRKRVNENTLKFFELPFPGIEEQKRIAAILKKIDNKIEVNNKINHELEAMAKTLYDYWFVQFDFPYVSSSAVENDPQKHLIGKPYKSSGGKMVFNEELKWEIPEGWEAGKANKILKFNPTESLSKGKNASYIDMNALPTEGYMTSEIQKKEFNGGMKFRNDDVLVARITPCLENGKTCLVTLLEEDEVGFGSTEYIVLRGKKRPLPAFASLLARSEYFRKYAIMNMTGTSGRKRVDSKQLRIIPIPIPPQDLLDSFETLIYPHFQKMTINTKENQKLSDLRDWLLPMLMNGQVTVGSPVAVRDLGDFESELNNDNYREVAEEGEVYTKKSKL